MRRLLLALPFALLPLAVAHAAVEHDHDHDEHGSLSAHEHGVSRLNAALDGQTLELELESPAMNLVGFEHAATTDADKAKVAAARAQLEKPLVLFNLPKAAGCVVATQELESPLFGDKPDADDHDEEDANDGHEHHQDHSEIHAHYQFSCSAPGALKTLDLANIFNTFPATQKIQVQLISPSGQQGVEVTAKAAALKF
ncbi:zinc-binding protein [Pseudomonas syringae]|uniref:Zinc-binding protein n=1 Tax=Pseudomonas syringae TaxID=317 RepID=A0A0L1LYB4_PSESX|nr:zinc-binding protein [Pseudomonas syringae]